MLPMRTAALPARLALAALLALLLSVRVIASAGYMPMVEHGQLALMLCPDGEWTAPAPAMPGMDRHAPKSPHHSECPFAAAAATPWANGSAAPAILVLAFAFAPLAVLALTAPARRMVFERPFSTGPPLPA